MDKDKKREIRDIFPVFLNEFKTVQNASCKQITYSSFNKTVGLSLCLIEKLNKSEIQRQEQAVCCLVVRKRLLTGLLTASNIIQLEQIMHVWMCVNYVQLNACMRCRSHRKFHSLLRPFRTWRLSWVWEKVRRRSR